MVTVRGKVPWWVGMLVAVALGACGGGSETGGSPVDGSPGAAAGEPGVLAMAADPAPAERRGERTPPVSPEEDTAGPPEGDSEGALPQDFSPAPEDVELPDEEPEAPEPLLPAPDLPAPRPETEALRPEPVLSPPVVDEVLPVGSSRWREEPLTVPAGTRLVLELETGLTTRHAWPGDRFASRVVEDVLAKDGMVLVPLGAVVEGVVTGVSRGDDEQGEPLLEVEPRALIMDGEVYDLSAAVVKADFRTVGRRGGAETAATAVAGAAAGAVLGKILGGDGKSAATGAVAGAAAGAAVGMARSGAGEVVLEPGSRMMVVLDEALTLR